MQETHKESTMKVSTNPGQRKTVPYKAGHAKAVQGAHRQSGHSDSICMPYKDSTRAYKDSTKPYNDSTKAVPSGSIQRLYLQPPRGAAP
eukprot:3941221-Rhodomonas_salina.1